MDIIKQIKIYPPANDGTSMILVIYEVEDILPEEDNGHYLSVDLGLHNLMTCYDNAENVHYWREYLSLSYFITRKSRESSHNGTGSRLHGEWSIRKHLSIWRGSI